MPRMSSRERMVAAIRCEPVDHVPLGQLFHSTVMDTPADKQWGDQFQRARVMKDMGIDPTIDIWLPEPQPPQGVTVRQWKEQDSATGDELYCAEYRTPAGNLAQKVRKTWDWCARTHYRFLPAWDGDAHRAADQYEQLDLLDDFFTRRYQVPLVRGPEDLDAFACLLQPPAGAQRDQWIRNAKRAGQIADELGLLTHARRVSVGDWFMWVCLIEDFCVAMIDDPQYIRRFFDVVQDYNRQIVDLVLEVRPDVVQYRGWYDTPDYWGRQRHRDILVPRIQELARQVHEGGSLFCYLLPEGYTQYKDILGQMDVDVLLGLEPYAARKSEDLAAVRAAMGGRHCIWGGVNSPIRVGRGSDEEIGAAVKAAIESLGPDGFILNASMYLYDDDVTWDRFEVFVEAWRKYAGIQ